MSLLHAAINEFYECDGYNRLLPSPIAHGYKSLISDLLLRARRTSVLYLNVKSRTRLHGGTIVFN